MSLTDGSVYCTWCGEDRTRCNLCGGTSVLASRGSLDIRSISEENQRRVNAKKVEEMKWLGDGGWNDE